jgi:photosystem II stability/assembly factor-like uncharacterized protein
MLPRRIGRANILPLLPVCFLLAVGGVLTLLAFAPAVEPPARLKQTSGAMHALDHWSRSRAYPGRVIPDVGHAAAYEAARVRFAGGAADQRGSSWDAIGPHNIGGRTLAVAQNPQNPQTMWAGAASGGLWRTHTAGVGPDAWDMIDTGFPLLGVSSIAIPPSDSNVIYIGTGEVYGYQNALGGLAVRLTRGSYGIGILKSTDGGATWTHSLNWSQNQKRGVASLAMDPSNSNILYAGTSEGTYKTTDAGATWNLVHNILMSMQVVIDPVTPSRLYAACGDLGSPGTGIYRSTDSGATWTQLTAGLPATWTGKTYLAIYKNAPNVVYASLAQAESGIGLYRSTNFGSNWTSLSTTNYAGVQGWYSHWVHVNPTDSSQVLVAGVDIWRSTQGGRNLVRMSDWSAWFFGNVPPGGPEGPPNYAHADHHHVIYDPQKPDTLFFGTDGGVFRSFDHGGTFAGLNGGYQTTQFYNGFSSAISLDTFAIGGMQDNATAIYEGNLGWRRVIGGDGCMTAMHPQNLLIMYGATQNLGIRRSTDGGFNFNSAVNGISQVGQVAFVAPYLLAPSVPTVMYAGRSRIFRSSNGGVNWGVVNSNLELDGNPAISMGISHQSENVLYVGTAPVLSRARIFVTTNGGTSFTNITGSLPDRYPVDITVDPLNDQIAYVVLSGFESGHLFRTSDRGANWTDISSDLPDVPSSAVVVDPDNTNIIYFGNDIGVYVSTDTGATWEAYQTGMPGAAILMDLSVVRSNRHIRAITHGHGNFEREMLEPTAAVADGGTGAPAAAGLRMLGAAPNPFRDATSLRFALAGARPVTVKLYDVAGRAVATLAEGEPRSAGEHAMRVDARTLGLAAGVYVARIEAGGEQATAQIVLAR